MYFIILYTKLLKWGHYKGKTRMGNKSGALTVLKPQGKGYRFRRPFKLDKPVDLKLALWATDGFIVYINGEEMERFNLPNDAPSNDIRALEDKPRPLGRGYPVKIPAKLLTEGDNVVCISISSHDPKPTVVIFGATLQRAQQK
jgi:hypothetical protein